MTNNSFDPNQKRGQPGNPGAWVQDSKSDPEATLGTTEPSPAQALKARLAADKATAKAIEEAARDERMNVTAELLRVTAADTFPDADKVTFYIPNDDQGDFDYQLAGAFDGDEIVYAQNEWGGNGHLHPRETELNELVKELGEYAYVHLDGDEPTNEELNDYIESDGNLLTLNLVRESPYSPFDLARAVGIDDLNRGSREDLATELNKANGQLDIGISKSAVEARLTENPEAIGFSPDLIGALDERFGGREQALTAIVGSNSWAKIPANFTNSAEYKLREGINSAARELLQGDFPEL